MGDFLRRLLGLTPKGGEHTDHMANKLKSLATYFDDIVKATEKSTVIKSVIESAPWWVGATATSAAESFPIIRFVATLVAEKVKIKDPDTLAFLACTLAYQKSIEDVFKANESNKEFAKVIVKKAKRNWAQLDTKELPDFKKFSLENAIQHPFITSAEAMFADLCEDLNFSKPLKTKLLLDVRHRFVINLKMLLSHGKTKV